MKMAMLIEYDNPKEEEKMKEYFGQADEVMSFWEKKKKQGVVKKTSNWSDNTGHMTFFVEFPSGETLGKFLADEEYHAIALKSFKYVDNISIRILRQGIDFKTGKPRD